jgi:hypothetical protein
MQTFRSQAQAICSARQFSEEDVYRLQEIAQAIGIDPSRFEPDQLCDIIENELRISMRLATATKKRGREPEYEEYEPKKLKVDPPSDVEPSLSLQDLPDELKVFILSLINDPASLASICSVNREYLEFCKTTEIPAGIRGEKISIWNYARAGLERCLLYQWLRFIQVINPPYEPFHLISLSKLQQIQLNAVSAQVDDPKFKFDGWIDRISNSIIPLHGTAQPVGPLYLVGVGYIAVQSLTTLEAKIPTLVPIMSRGNALAYERQLVYNFLRSKEFKEDVIETLKFHYYEPYAEFIRHEMGIAAKSCARYWIADIYDMNWYVRYGIKVPYRQAEVSLYYEVPPAQKSK